MAADIEEATALIEAQAVTVRGIPTPKALTLVAADTPIEWTPEPPQHVGRGGLKLAGALAELGVDPSGLMCLDAGASTGGFTDHLLQSGAASVVAVDVGYGQLDDRIAADPRVTVLDRTNIRHLEPSAIGGVVDLIVGDLSFISLCSVVPAITRLVRPGGDVVMLVKPQFEAAPADVGAGGIVRDRSVRHAAVERVVGCFEAGGLAPQAVVRSPITGAKGNIEYFIWAVADGRPRPITIQE